MTTKTAKKTATLSKADAALLWGKLRNALTTTQDAIAEIIRVKAWEPLGYQTFAAAWDAEMKDITLATELRPFVVYQLLAEGEPPMAVAAQVKGVGPMQVEHFDVQRKRGVPANLAVHRVREHFRAERTHPGILRIPVGAEDLKRYKTIAQERGFDLDKFLAEAIRKTFAELERAK